MASLSSHDAVVTAQILSLLDTLEDGKSKSVYVASPGVLPAMLCHVSLRLVCYTDALKGRLKAVITAVVPELAAPAPAPAAASAPAPASASASTSADASSSSGGAAGAGAGAGASGASSSAGELTATPTLATLVQAVETSPQSTSGALKLRDSLDALALMLHTSMLMEGFQCTGRDDQDGAVPGFAAPIRRMKPHTYKRMRLLAH